MVCPRAAFTVILAVAALAIFVECLFCRSTGCTPSAMLKSEHVEASSAGRDSALSYRVRTASIRSIQDGIFSFKCGNCTVPCVFITSHTGVVYCKESRRLFKKLNFFPKTACPNIVAVETPRVQLPFSPKFSMCG